MIIRRIVQLNTKTVLITHSAVLRTSLKYLSSERPDLVKPTSLEDHDVTYQEQHVPKLINFKDIDIDKNNINVSQILRNIQKNVKLDPGSRPSNSLTTQYWVERHVKLKELPAVYMSLAKSRLTTLVVLTAIAGFAFNPVHGSATAFIAMTTGTFLCSASANTFNQVMEWPYDSQMDRCRQRVLVRQLITPLHALTFGVSAGLTGTVILYQFVNPLTAALGASNIALYAGLYTVMKRYTSTNTWVGAVVGAIPPAMGWAACNGSLELGALALCGIIYFWQFPHFNALSYNYRIDYCRAGYHMMSVTNPRLNGVVSLRNTAALIPLCMLIPFTNISHCSFSFYSLLLNTYFTYLAWNFYKDQNKQTARDLFRFSLVYLPILFGSLAIGYAFKKRTDNDPVKHHEDKDYSNPEMKYVKDLCPFIPQSNS